MKRSRAAAPSVLGYQRRPGVHVVAGGQQGQPGEGLSSVFGGPIPDDCRVSALDAKKGLVFFVFAALLLVVSASLAY